MDTLLLFYLMVYPVFLGQILLAVPFPVLLNGTSQMLLPLLAELHFRVNKVQQILFSGKRHALSSRPLLMIWVCDISPSLGKAGLLMLLKMKGYCHRTH